MFISPRVAMTGPLNISPAAAEAACLRHWGRHDAHRLALAIATGTYPKAEAERELATTLAWHAEQAGIRSVSCRALAASMLEDAEANRCDTTERIKRLVAPLIAARHRRNAVLAEAHGVNGSDGFPLTEDEVTGIVRREIWFSLPPAQGARRHVG